MRNFLAIDVYVSVVSGLSGRGTQWVTLTGDVVYLYINLRRSRDCFCL